MINDLKTPIGRLRLLALLEGTSLLVLVFISLPLKYYLGSSPISQWLGPIHGALFLLFVFNTLSVAIEQSWSFKNTTWKVLLACLIPFGTFYIDYQILRPLQKAQNPS